MTPIVVLSILVLVTLAADVIHWRWRGGRLTYFTGAGQTRNVGIALTVVGIAVTVAAMMVLLGLVKGEWFLTLLFSWGIAQSAYSILCRELEWRRRRGTVA